MFSCILQSSIQWLTLSAHRNHMSSLLNSLISGSTTLCIFNKYPAAAAAAKSLQSCLTLCDPIDGSPPGSSIPGILQARTLEWVAISFSNAWKWKVKVKSLSHVWLLATPWTAAYQAPSSIGFFQARILEWVDISFSNAWKWKVKVKSLSHVWLLATPWNAAHQAPPSMG